MFSLTPENVFLNSSSVIDGVRFEIKAVWLSGKSLFFFEGGLEIDTLIVLPPNSVWSNARDFLANSSSVNSI